MFDWEHGLLCTQCRGFVPHLPPGGGGCLMGFLELGQEPWYILKLQQEWPFETPLCSAKSGLLSS